MGIIENIFILIISHFIGDYVLQSDFIAKTKGDNIYHLLVHCFLYCTPFLVVYGFGFNIIILLITHVVIDSLKARYKKINYVTDQILHFIIIFTLFLI